MGKYVLGVLFSLLLSSCVTVPLASKDYRIGDVFTDRIHVGRAGSYIPLPEGDWELVGKGQISEKHTFNTIWLAQFEDTHIEALIRVETPHFIFDNGLTPATYCKDDEYYYSDVRKMASIVSLENDCLILLHKILRAELYENQFEKDALSYMNVKADELPNTMVGVNFFKSNESAAFDLYYFFNPVLEGFQDDVKYMDRWSESKWHKWRLKKEDKIWAPADRQERVEYYDKILKWAKEWEPKVDAGLLGQELIN